jgi:Domain of Unknown Function with PDB structure (DUF3857)/Protein of unknown function (DUF2569)/Transglutaminase-like superfamily
MHTSGRLRSSLAGAVLAIVPTLASAGASKPAPRVAPAPTWAEPVEVPNSGGVPTDEISHGTWHLLSDRQVRVTGSSRETFSHFARKIVNDAGLEDSSQISIDFEPSYQGLMLHWVRLRRDGQWLDRLSLPKVKVIQRETELESQIYDGRLSAVLFLEDLRVGDVLDYAFTLRGTNPVLRGLYTDSFAVDWTVRLERMRFRLLWPTDRRLTIRNHGTNLAPTVRERGGLRELVWERRSIPGLANEGQLPPWYDPWGWVQLSEYQSWRDVADWGRKLFEVEGPLPADLEAKLEEWRGRYSDPERQAVLALRFVQDEVRYLGFEMGPNSHRPTSPEVVFRRRFGDCKDKALLLCALLRRLGLRADPALVSTSAGQMLNAWLPTPLAFDHAVSVVDVGGRRIWLDPTISGQGGSLSSVHFPAYGHGLVLAEGSAELLHIPRALPAAPSVVVHESFSSKGFDDPVEFVVESRYEGKDADGVRSTLLEKSRVDLGKQYMKYYAETYAQIQSLALPESQDDREANVLIVRERYSIPGFWTKPGDHGRKPEAQVYPSAVEGLVLKLATAPRTMPLGLRYPVKVRQVTEVSLPEDWSLPSDTQNLDDASVRFRFKSTYQPRRLKLEYDYETLRDGVPAAEIEAHRRLLAGIHDRLGYKVTYPSPRADAGVNWPAVLALSGFVPFALVASTGFLRRRVPRARERIRDPALAGLRGWLLLLGAFLLFLPLRFALDLHSSRAVWSLQDWLSRTTPGRDDYHPLWAPYLLGGLLGNAALLCAALVLLFLFFTRRANFPRVLIAFLGLRAVMILVIAGFARWLPGPPESAVDAVFGAFFALVPLAAFVPYLFLSDRPRSTFVR